MSNVQHLKPISRKAKRENEFHDGQYRDMKSLKIDMHPIYGIKIPFGLVESNYLVVDKLM